MTTTALPVIGIRTRRDGFTLVELMVVLIIVATLSSLTLAGLTVAQRRSKADKTRATIRKLHEIVVPHYESFLRRRVPLPPGLTSGTAIALERLTSIRTLSLVRMPDSWGDVATSGLGSTGTFASGTPNVIPSFAWDGVARAYGATRAALPITTQFQSSECLYMIVSRGLQEPDALAQFRADEIGDADRDGALEFHDGWRQPIMFVRWPVGFRSIIQSQNAGAQPDPFDPSRVSGTVVYPWSLTSQRDYAVVPLICSAGADGNYGISTGTIPWSGTNALFSAAKLATIRIETGTSAMTGTTAPGTASFPDAADNITNHDLTTK
jgi:prepilin-type N-terminal cleavage/methylation domain-containing protein